MQNNRNLIKCLMNSGLETESCFSFEAKEVKSFTVDLKMHVQKLLRMYFYTFVEPHDNRGIVTFGLKEKYCAIYHGFSCI